jgi:hypothetical protein
MSGEVYASKLNLNATQLMQFIQTQEHHNKISYNFTAFPIIAFAELVLLLWVGN